MCLKSITRVIENPSLDELVGYKVVYIEDDKVIPPYYKPNGDSSCCGTNEIPTNEWLVSTPSEVSCNDTDSVETDTKYQTGFHIFTTLDGALTWSHASHVIQVKYRLVTYHGTECKDQTVHIAREMYIPWPQTPVEIK